MAECMENENCFYDNPFGKLSLNVLMIIIIIILQGYHQEDSYRHLTVKLQLKDYELFGHFMKLKLKTESNLSLIL